MKADKRKKLEAAGWKAGTASEFLQLDEAEEALVNMKIDLASKVREMRKKKHMSQQRLAKLLGSSQSRVAKLETADRSVSMELMIKSLVTLGATRHQIGKVVSSKRNTGKASNDQRKRQATKS